LVRAFRATHQAGHRFYRKATGNSGRKSENHKGGGRKVKLSIEEQILLTLMTYDTTFQLLGIQFEVSESTANDTFNYWLPLLQELLPSSLLEQVKKKPVTTKLFEILTEYELIVDSAEQPEETWSIKNRKVLLR